ncbi:MAG: M1 family metallopeptidase [bacterium]|nr:M1 family metallopeptidase [bacterium]
MSKRRILCGPLAILIAVTSIAAAELSDDVRKQLEAVVEQHAAELHKQKNDAGVRAKRGSYSKHFRPLEGDAYRVAFTEQTAAPTRMTTERYLLTLSRGASGEFEIAERELQDTYDGLVRYSPSDVRFHRFDTLRLDHEGLRLSATDGTLVADRLLGNVFRMRISADTLRYEYAPPVDLPFYEHSRWQYVLSEHDQDLVFEPDVVTLTCDPETCAEILQSGFDGLQPVERDALLPVLEKHDDKLRDAVRKGRRENAFSGFHLPPRPERRNLTASLKKRGKDHRLIVDYDSTHPSEVRLRVSGYGVLLGYPSRETRESGVAPYEIELRDDANGLDFELQGLEGRVELAVEDSESLRAELMFSLVTKRPLRAIPFSFTDLNGILGGRRSSDRNPSIVIDLLETEDEQDLTWVRRGSSGGLVIFPEQLSAGTHVGLKMRYRNRGSILKLSPSYSYLDRGGWLPFVRYTDKIEQFSLEIVTPERYKTLGIGTKTSEETRDGLTTTRWVASSPVHFPTIIFGEYVEDRPRIKAEKFDGTEIEVGVHVDRHGMSDWGIRPSQLQPMADQAVNALNVYRELYGVDYPYGKLDLVNQPFGFIGGQAPASIVYLSGFSFRATGSIAGFLLNPQYISRFKESLIPHEVAHQWWGSLVGTRNMGNYWFVESLAEYSAALFIEVAHSDGYKRPAKGRKAYLDHVEMWRSEILGSELTGSVQDARTQWTGGSYRAAVYAKGPYAFHILRSTFGDERFFDFLRQLARELAGREIVTRDIQRVAEVALGGVQPDGTPFKVDLDWFFDQWIRGVGLPEYRFTYDWSKTEDGNFMVEGKITQRVVLGRKKRELDGVFFQGVVPITVLGKDNREYPAKVWVEGAETPFRFKVPVKPLEVTLNKYGAILAHEVLGPR